MMNIEKLDHSEIFCINMTVGHILLFLELNIFLQKFQHLLKSFKP